jgi:hypothetical protein
VAGVGNQIDKWSILDMYQFWVHWLNRTEEFLYRIKPPIEYDKKGKGKLQKITYPFLEKTT